MSNDKKPEIFKWNRGKLLAAKEIADGSKTHGEIAKELKITQQTISRWKQFPEFLEKIDEFILADARATKAGILKAALDAAEIKKKHIEDDKSTYLDYIKTIADVQGHNKKQIEHSGELKTTSEAVLFYLPTNGRDAKEIKEDDG